MIYMLQLEGGVRKYDLYTEWYTSCISSIGIGVRLDCHASI